jgi:hypothetical protein
MRMTHLNDGRFELESMSGQKVILTQREVDQLAKLAGNSQDQPQRSPTRADPGLVTTRESRVVVSVDAHHTEVILRFGEKDFERAYMFTPDSAQQIVNGIVKQLALIAASSGRAKQ